ncbi:hypothetical protein H0H92_006990 [Tricholoma furcatifolium]|nr:hypothetical protein H0H92_006990 [Tricholoma furcatifolium]
MSRVFPESSQEHLRISLEYMMVFLMLEQLTDTPATTAEAQKWADVYSQAFKQVLGESKGPASIIKQLRIAVESNILLAKGVVKEAADRENPATELTLEAYMEARRDSIGLRPFLDIGRWSQDIDISRDVLMHPEIAKLEEQTIDLVSLANDLYSYKKEFFESGAHHNYVTGALSDPISGVSENDRQGAIDYTCRIFSEILADFLQRTRALSSFGEDVDGKVTEYIGVMLDLIVGNIQWSLACRRYGHSDVKMKESATVWGDVVFEMDPL